MRLYEIYSSIVFQMLAIIALGFWGGKKINDYLELPNDLLTVAIGLAGLGLALYSTLKQLENIQTNNAHETVYLLVIHCSFYSGLFFTFCDMATLCK